MLYILFAILGFVGVLSRYFLGAYFTGAFVLPLGTLIANIVGSFVMGWLYSLSQSGNEWPHYVILALTVGLLGALTTFSGFALDTIKLFQAGQWLWGGLNILLTNLFCLLACFLGLRIAN